MQRRNIVKSVGIKIAVDLLNKYRIIELITLFVKDLKSLYEELLGVCTVIFLLEVR